jgi:5-hydroxyisourate hydrolase-like protein (transthyretin family)
MNSPLEYCLGGAAILSLCLSWGCGAEQRGDRIETFPVTGEVSVDGQPAKGLQVTCNLVGTPSSNKFPPVIRALTKDDGAFALTSYESGDGAPQGEYTLTFMWGAHTPFKGYSGDKLNGRYADPKASQVKVTVTDQPVDVGKIELTTK